MAVDYIKLVVSAGTLAASGIFGVLSWGIRLALKRAVDRFEAIPKEVDQRLKDYDERLENRFRDIELKRHEMGREFYEHREWTRTILAVAGVVTPDGEYTGVKFKNGET